MNALNVLIEFYLSLIAYFILHMIFVIASDFVEAFNIPPLNIGIYVDKLAAIRALLMVIADILEWWITQETLHDPGAFKTLSEPSPRRIASVLSFIIMMICRIVYLILIYKSDNKSLTVFITLCIEGFWFGVFQMSFFAVGPQYNAFTSFGIHTMGNFIFFLQVILNKLAKSYPGINSLYRVRVHAWIVVITSIIALGLWVYFCEIYLQGDSDQFQSLVCVLKETKTDQTASDATANKIAEKLAEKMRSARVSNLHGALNKCTDLKKKFDSTNANQLSKELGGNSNGSENVAKLLVKAEFGYDFSGNLTGNLTGENNTVTVDISDGGDESGSTEVKVSITGSSGGNTHFTGLAEKIKPLAEAIKTRLDGNMNLNDSEIKNALNASKDDIATKIKALISGATNVTSNNISVEGTDSSKKVTVSVTGSGGAKTASVEMTKGEKTVEVEFKVTADATKNQHIASLLALAMVHKDVKSAVKEQKYELRVKGGVNDKVTIQVNKAKSKAQANRIAFKLGNALCKVDSVTKTLGNSESIKVQVSINQDRITGTWTNVLSPFLLFIIGAFAEDFSVPGILPFAFLDPEKANLVNYLTPSFFMTGAMIVVFLNDFFHPTGFAKGSGDSWFKDWSENEGTGQYYHGMWLFNVPKYLAFIISMWAIHGTFADLRCIIQSRWRVLVLTMVIVVLRAMLEVMGYVGVANYAIFAGDTGDFDGFKFIVWHDVLAMFCRFVYGKFAVGYNWTRVSLGYCLPKFRPRHKGFGFGFWWWVGRTLSRAWADTVKDFKADIKCYL